MRIPEKFRDIMRTAGKDGVKVGVQLSVDFLKEAKPAVAGMYLMPPFQKYHVIDDILGAI